MNEKEKLLHRLITASIAGYENLVVWADLLDRINVFPVADGDTGANLRVSLAPLRDGDSGMADVVGRLSLSGRGNSGNIAVAFLREFLSPENFDLELQAKKGREMAWKAVFEPRTGTMLTVFDTLASVLEEERDSDPDYISIRKHLQNAVLATAEELPELKEAGVVDSGALGMFLFFDGFFQTFTRQPKNVSSITDLFGKTLSLDESFHPQATGEYCVEASLVIDDDQDNLNQRIANLGNSAVIVPDDSGVKLHIHTRDPEELRSKLAMLGDVVNWSDEAMDSMLTDEKRKSFASNTIRIMTDAAGSVPRDLAHSHGIILLDSYILAQDQVLPESLFSPEQLYLLMKAGTRVSTAQASNHERYLHYDAAVQQYGKVLYLSTGSAFTGNFAVADDWQKAHDSGHQFTVLDSGAASGRLAVIALLTARFAEGGAESDAVITYAENLTKEAEEFVFIHELKYLVAGGRVSKTKAFFGDLLQMKPVISPTFEGVKKVGVVRNRDAQLEFAKEKISAESKNGTSLLVLLQYTDNVEWLTGIVKPQIEKLLPEAEILLLPISLTSGVHMGPGTWSIAFASKREAE